MPLRLEQLAVTTRWLSANRRGPRLYRLGLQTNVDPEKNSVDTSASGSKPARPNDMQVRAYLNSASGRLLMVQLLDQAASSGAERRGQRRLLARTFLFGECALLCDRELKYADISQSSCRTLSASSGHSSKHQFGRVERPQYFSETYGCLPSEV